MNILKPTPVKVSLSLAVALLLVLFLPLFPTSCPLITRVGSLSDAYLREAYSGIGYNCFIKNISIADFLLNFIVNALFVNLPIINLNTFIELFALGIFVPYLVISFLVEMFSPNKNDKKAEVWKVYLVTIFKSSASKIFIAILLAIAIVVLFILYTPVIGLGCMPGFGNICENTLPSIYSYLSRLSAHDYTLTPIFNIHSSAVLSLLLRLILIPYPLAGLVVTVFTALKQSVKHKKRA